MKRKLTVGVGVVATALLLSVGAVAPAQAADTWSRCPDNHLCVFTGTWGQGAMAAYQVGDPNLGDAFGPQGMNDNIESVWNRTNAPWTVLRNVGGTQGLVLWDQVRSGTLDGFSNNISAIVRGLV